MKLQPALDVSLEAKAVKFLDSVDPDEESAEAFLHSFGGTITVSSTVSGKNQLALIKADLISQLVITLNPLSLSFVEAEDIHSHLMSNITNSVCLASADTLDFFGIKDPGDQQTVQKTVLQQVLYPSEKYICHLCVNRYSIMDGDISKRFLTLLAQLLEISPHYQPTMDFVMNMPVILTIPRCLTFFETVYPNFDFLFDMNAAQRRWNKTRGEVRQMWKKVLRMLRMEGMEDVIVEEVHNREEEFLRTYSVTYSIEWNNAQGMNLPRRE
ncbi:hypothetical protein BLNAU_9954 [Blattamonas nauphoetae]|uniref:Uncharacterized protein n=1 Tax=Blattamonas nauphoetae TaxID=2049346 RepID=A0ABQ9XU70_9EUKA|nr:hypothetical protein BLNAU_9954 [Blattamonas nauphoetae]